MRNCITQAKRNEACTNTRPTHTENWLCWKTPWVITNFHSVMCFCVKLVTRFIVGVTSFDLFALSFRRISFCVPSTRRSSTMVWITQSSSVHASAVHNIAQCAHCTCSHDDNADDYEFIRISIVAVEENVCDLCCRTPARGASKRKAHGNQWLPSNEITPSYSSLCKVQ